MECDTKRQQFERNRGEDAYDEIARENREVSPKHLRYTYLSIFYVAGTLLLFTCRTDFALEEALRECSKYGLYFDEVNRTTQRAIDKWREKHPHSSISSKVSADLYIDDKAYPNNITGIDWTLLSRELLKEEGMQYV